MSVDIETVAPPAPMPATAPPISESEIRRMGELLDSNNVRGFVNMPSGTQWHGIAADAVFIDDIPDTPSED